ncbi:MAG: hypothetical protein U9R72_05705 [Chloroflexota bacterium]|nr:hypothetical protein [Chloroflexota bacterium]
MTRKCVLATLGNDPHTQGLYKASRIARRAGIAVRLVPPGTAISEIMDLIHRQNASYVGLSYRLSPDVGLRELTHFLNLLDESGLLRRADGAPRKVAFAGLPETIRAVEESGHSLPCQVTTIPQDDDLLDRAARVLRFFDVPDSQSQAILRELEGELYPPTILELDQLARAVTADDSYREEPPLPIPSPAAMRSLSQRIGESDLPVLRTHFGVPGASIQPTVEGVAELAESRVIDEMSLGSSDLSQRYFGRPEEFTRRKNDGGVPYQTFHDLLELAGATRRGNFPSIKPYAHVVDLVDFVDTCLRAGMLIGAHQAIPLYWFNELDGRGPMSVAESIVEHLAAVRRLAERGIPVEMNDPNQWSSRWAHDTIICADYGLITAVMLNAGVRDLVLQMQFNKPRETGDLADLAKMTASLQLVNELLPPGVERPRIWRQTRTGVGYFDPDPDRARFQLARSTFLQMMVSPHIIHVVSYCEADHAATVEDIVDSSRLVRRCVRTFRQHERELKKHLHDPTVVERREFLVKEARFLLRRIARLGQGGPAARGRGRRARDGTTLGALVPDLADAGALHGALRRGHMAAPGIFHPSYPAGRSLTTGPTRNGFIDCLDPRADARSGVMREEARLSFLGAE